jgi:SP family facilitated glucose transporter-like MFS transporter 1
MFFSTKIFRMAQLDEESAQYATLGMGAVNVFMTLVSMVLIEKAGRKTLLLIGFVGMCLTTVLLTICLTYVQVLSHSLILSVKCEGCLILTHSTLCCRVRLCGYRTSAFCWSSCL